MESEVGKGSTFLFHAASKSSRFIACSEEPGSEVSQAAPVNETAPVGEAASRSVAMPEPPWRSQNRLPQPVRIPLTSIRRLEQRLCGRGSG